MSNPRTPVERVVCNARVGNLEIEARTGIDGSYITITDVRALTAVLLGTAATLAGAAADGEGD